jgi:putative FmdB family regulatory protein
MPLYEYECEQCAQRFERIQKFSDPPVDLCPSCGGAVRKLLSSPAIQFKGAGWYITDYARKGSGGDSGKADATKADATKTDSTKTESAKTESSGSGSKSGPDSGTKTA